VAERKTPRTGEHTAQRGKKTSFGWRVVVVEPQGDGEPISHEQGKSKRHRCGRKGGREGGPKNVGGVKKRASPCLKLGSGTESRTRKGMNSSSKESPGGEKKKGKIQKHWIPQVEGQYRIAAAARTRGSCETSPAKCKVTAKGARGNPLQGPRQTGHGTAERSGPLEGYSKAKTTGGRN